MNVLIIWETFDELLRKMKNISGVIKFKKQSGFRLFQSDELWDYHAVHDSRLCPVCRGFAADSPYRGDQVKRMFPYVHVTGFGEARPEVHSMPKYSWLEGRCRCTVKMRDIAETMENRLHKLKVEVSRL